MKVYVKCSDESGSLLSSEDGLFDLIEISGVGMNRTPWHGLHVKSKGLAEKHVVEIRLEQVWVDYDGTPIEYSYEGVRVAHGMRSKADTLEDTQEYIQVMQSALKFAYQVEDFLAGNGWLV